MKQFEYKKKKITWVSEKELEILLKLNRAEGWEVFDYSKTFFNSYIHFKRELINKD